MKIVLIFLLINQITILMQKELFRKIQVLRVHHEMQPPNSNNNKKSKIFLLEIRYKKIKVVIHLLQEILFNNHKIKKNEFNIVKIKIENNNKNLN